MGWPRAESRTRRGWIVASEVIPDEPGSVGSTPEGSQQVSVGSLSWETCDPAALWERTAAWSAGALDSGIAAGYTHLDWLFSATITMYWYVGATEVRRESRVFTWLNGAVVTDATTIDGAPGDLADSAIESVAVTRSTYTFTPVSPYTVTPPNATFQRPDEILTTLRQEWFDQTGVVYEDFNMVVSYALSNVFRGTADFFGIPIALNTGDVGTIAWNIWRSHDADPYGLAWEDCSPPDPGGGDADCTCEAWTRRAPCAGDTGSRRAEASSSATRQAPCAGDTGTRRRC